MKRYREFREECIILEHPNLKARIIAKINPMDAIRDKMDDIKKLPGKIKDKAIDKLKDISQEKMILRKKSKNVLMLTVTKMFPLTS